MLKEKKDSIGYLVGIRAKGGPGSGNFGHAGRPGQQGGSAGTSGSAAVPDHTPFAGEESLKNPKYKAQFNRAKKASEAAASTLYARTLKERRKATVLHRAAANEHRAAAKITSEPKIQQWHEEVAHYHDNMAKQANRGSFPELE
jgi:hypothetical protein